MREGIQELLGKWGVVSNNPNLLLSAVHLIIVLIICFLVYLITKKVLLKLVNKLSNRTKTTWDDKLVESHFFKKLAVIIPIIILLNSLIFVFKPFPEVHAVIKKILEVILVINFGAIIIAFINAMQKILKDKPSLRDKPLNSYSQLIKIIILIIFGIIIFSILTGKTPLFFITAMGAMSAIVLLIFKDTILGFVGSIQLATNDMVRIGDWITMEKYGADGNVEEINLATIKVQNFDKTITTIPTYSLISDSFKNWRGMEEANGRRIKRAINIKIDSINFCSKESLDRFKEIKLIQSYLQEKEIELSQYNKDNNLESNKVNGRNLTNIGVFRKYVELYLHSHPMVNHNMTCMVRQLSPTEKGLPIEIYAFSKDKEWVNYENILADIFDHILAIVTSFELEVFQSPTGSDFSKIGS